MSSIISSLLNATVGFLVNKGRDYVAGRLEGGDLTDEQCRQLIIREFDDVKSKLDGLARSTLLASIDFFDQGLRSFMLCQKEPVTSQTTKPQENQAKGPINEACALLLSDQMKQLKITSKERYEKAVRYFEKSEEEATRAFSNEALSITDRIFASNLRMVSAILQSPEDPDSGIDTCLLYLEKLHKLPAVEEMFGVYLGGGWKARLNKDKREENVLSVTRINHAFRDFELKFGKKGTNLHRLFIGWPTIQLGKETYNPLETHKKISAKMDEGWIKCSEKNYVASSVVVTYDLYVSAVTSQRKLLTHSDRLEVDVFVVDVGSDSKEVFWSLPHRKDERKDRFDERVLAILTDGDDNVYIVYQTKFSDTGHSDTDIHKLVCLDQNGNVQSQATLEFLEGIWYKPICALAKDGTMVIIDAGNMYICQTSNGELKHMISLNGHGIDCWPHYISVTDNNEIILASYDTSYPVYTCTMSSEVVRELKFPDRNNVHSHVVRSLAFNHVTKDILVFTWQEKGDKDSYYLSKFSPNCDQPQTVDITSLNCDEYSELRSHPSGLVALVKRTSALFLQ